MSTLDSHTICQLCRDQVCDLDNRCNECSPWSVAEMEDYIKNRKLLESKSKKPKVDAKPKASNVGNPKSSSTAAKKSDSKALRSMETRLQDNLKDMFKDLSRQVLESVQDLNNRQDNRSFSAPLEVPDMDSKLESAEGRARHDERHESLGLKSLPLGEVPLSNEDPSNPPNVSHVCSLPCYVTQVTECAMSSRIDSHSLDVKLDDSLVNYSVGQVTSVGSGQCHGPHLGTFSHPKMSTSVVSVSSSVAPVTFSPLSLLFPFSRPESSPLFSPSVSLPSSSSSVVVSPSLPLLPPSVPPPSLPPLPPLPQFSASHVPSSVLLSAPSAPPIVSVSSFPPLSGFSQYSLSQPPLPPLPLCQSNLPPASSTYSRTVPPVFLPPPPVSVFGSGSSLSSAASSLPSTLGSLFSSVSSAANFVSSSSGNTSLADYNAGILGLSTKYRNLAQFYFNRMCSLSREFVARNHPELLSDYDRDHQGGDSVFMGSLRVDSTPSSSSPRSSVYSSVGVVLPPPPLPPVIKPAVSAFPVSFTHSVSSMVAQVASVSSGSSSDLMYGGSSLASSGVIISGTVPSYSLPPGQSGFGGAAPNYAQAPLHLTTQTTTYPGISQTFSTPFQVSQSQYIQTTPYLTLGPALSQSSQLSRQPQYVPQTFAGSDATPPVPLPGSGIPPVFSGIATSSVSGTVLAVPPGIVSQPWIPPVSVISGSSSQAPVLSVPSGFSVEPLVAAGPSVSVSSAKPPFRPFEDPDPETRQDIEDPPHDRTFDTDADPTPPLSRSSEYRRMLEFIHALFPQSKGEPLSQRSNRSAFEDIFPGSRDPLPPFPTLTLFERVQQAFRDADDRLFRNVSYGKADRFLLPKRKPIYHVADLPSEGSAVPPNAALDSHMTKKLANCRSVSLSINECTHLESTFRSMSETLSHSMWILTGLLSLIRNEGFVPKDQQLFQQFISSLSMGMAHQANIAAAGTTFSALKRRQLYASHFLPSYPEALKQAALASPTCFTSSLFSDEDLTRLASVSNEASSIKSNQALLDFVSSGRRPRSPRRSPRSYSGYNRNRRRSSRSPPRTPKRVRFAGTPPPSPSRSSPSTSSSSSANLAK